MGEKERKEEHKKFVKKFILEYLKTGDIRLSEFNEKTQMYPLNCMSEEEFAEFLKRNGYRFIEIRDYLIRKNGRLAESG